MAQLRISTYNYHLVIIEMNQLRHIQTHRHILKLTLYIILYTISISICNSTTSFFTRAYCENIFGIKAFLEYHFVYNQFSKSSMYLPQLTLLNCTKHKLI